jgi:hypothetical protein
MHKPRLKLVYEQKYYDRLILNPCGVASREVREFPVIFYFIILSLLLWKSRQQEGTGERASHSVISACLNVATVDMKINKQSLLLQVEMSLFS